MGTADWEAERGEEWGRCTVRDGDGYRRLIRWEDNVANLILGAYSNSHLAYAPGLELRHPIMSILGGHVVK